MSYSYGQTYLTPDEQEAARKHARASAMKARRARSALLRREGIREAAEIIRKWSRADHFLLHAGEMTAGERRAVKAVLGGVLREVEAMADRPPA